MAQRTWILCVLTVVTSSVYLAVVGVCAPPPSVPVATPGTEADLPATVVEARGRARVLHETIHGVLQVVHRDFFRDDQRLSIPSKSFEDVFKELARSRQVQIHWLVVNAEAMNVDNKPRDDFEKDAVQALASGKREFEAIDGNVYRFAGSIRLASQCQKCHVPRRTSTEDRTAGLVIAMPLRNVP